MNRQLIQQSTALLKESIEILNKEPLFAIDLHLSMLKIIDSYNKLMIAEKQLTVSVNEKTVVAETEIENQPVRKAGNDDKKEIASPEITKKSAELPPANQKPPEPEKLETEQEIIPNDTKDKKIIAEVLATPQTPVYEHISKIHSKKDIVSTLQSTPIQDIEKAIGVNESFLFIRELFNGNVETYQKTIRHINQAANFNEAFLYLEQTFSWDFESELVKRLLELLRRRYIRE